MSPPSARVPEHRTFAFFDPVQFRTFYDSTEGYAVHGHGVPPHSIIIAWNLSAAWLLSPQLELNIPRRGVTFGVLVNPSLGKAMRQIAAGYLKGVDPDNLFILCLGSPRPETPVGGLAKVHISKTANNGFGTHVHVRKYTEHISLSRMASVRY